MPTVIKEQPIPIYETTCYECGSVFRYKAVEVSWLHITCPVCGVSNWASLTPINDNGRIWTYYSCNKPVETIMMDEVKDETN